MHKVLFLVFAALALFLPGRAHAYCYGLSPWDTTSGHVCGEVYRVKYNGYQYYRGVAGWTNVRICSAGMSANCKTITTSGYTDAWGGPVQAFLFYRFSEGFQTYYLYDLYAWGVSSGDYWGSDTVPVRKNIWVGPEGNHGIQLEMPPRPLDPAPVYPTGTNVGNSYLVRWKSGRDLDRQPYTITYEIWYKYWPFGGTEPSSFTLARADMPCHDNGSNTPDSSNECTTYIVGPQPAGYWKWYVVANLAYPGIPTRTQSGEMSFTQPNP